MKQIRLTSLTFTVACAMAATFATSAWAIPAEFKAETYPAVVTAFSTNGHGFSVSSGQLISVCNHATFATGGLGAPNVQMQAETLTVRPFYTECHVSVAGLGNSEATVATEGCSYIFKSKNPDTSGATMEVKCTTGKEITVTDNAVPTCKMKMGTQNLTGIEYHNEAGPPKEFLVNTEVSGMKWTTENCGIATSGTDGVYRQGKLNGAISEIEPSGHPATVKTKGETEKKAADGVEVAAAIPPHYYLNSTTEQGKVPEGAKIPTLSWGTLTLTPAAPSKEGPTSCENAADGFIENPAGGGAGTGQASAFLSANCEKPSSCPTGSEIEFPSGSGKKAVIEPDIFPGGELDGVHEDVFGESFPWPNELSEPEIKKIRQETKGVVEILGCAVKKSVEGSAPLGDGDGDTPQFVKKMTVCFTNPLAGDIQNPLAENGTQVGGPLTSKLKWDTKSGHLLCKGEGEGGVEIEFTSEVSGSLKTFTYEGQELVMAR